uniref:Pentacotripeptide-repeat region of PRORP domain-containing protein n=1 Tax=Daucus carota subsp. sativus TaxID=79200 RepID=A0A166D4C2_DAUCS
MRRQAPLFLKYTSSLTPSFFKPRFKFSQFTPSIPNLNDNDDDDDNNQPSRIVDPFLVDEFSRIRDAVSTSTSSDLGNTSCNDVYLLVCAFRDNDDKLIRQFRPKLNEDFVIRVFNSMQNAELCVKFFLWAGNQIGYTHSVAVYDALLDALGCGENRRLSEQLLSDIKKHDKEVLGKLLNVMITKFCRTGCWNVALEELGKLKDLGYRPSRGTYNALIQVLLQADKLDMANLLHKEMLDLGLYMDRYTLGCFAYTFCRKGKWKEALDLIEKEEFTPDTVIYSQMISGLCEASLFEEAMDILNIMRVNSCLPNVVTYKILLCGCLNKQKLGRWVVLNKINVSNFARCLCGAGKFEKAQKIISEMMTKGFTPDASTYSHVISYLCNASKVDKAFQLFSEMKKNGIVPDVYTYTILIDSFCKAGLIEQARSWFDEMVRDGCSPNVVTYTAIIHSYLKARKVSDANELFQLMVSEGHAPNIVTISALIDGYCKSGDTEKACQIYARMIEVKEAHDDNMYFEVDDNKAMEPNVVTYGALVDGLCKAHRVKEARNLLDVMSSKGCVPNHIVYDALIDGYCKVGKLEEAQEIFSKMSEHGYSPNAYTYSSLIDRLFKDKRLDLALRVLSKMLENSCPPNVVIYTEMIDGLCKVGKTDEAYKLMLMMEEKGCHPNVVTYTAMMDGFGKAGKVSKSLDLLAQMGTKGCAPNYVTYSVLINHCCAAGLLDEALQLLEEMKQTYWPRHIASYSKVIEGFSRDFISSLGVLAEINECESIPLVPVYGLMIDCFRKAGRLEIALELHEDISSSLVDSYIKTDAFSSLIESLCYSNKFEKAFGLYTDLIRKGGLPEISDFTSLIKGLIRVDRWEEALQLSHGLCCMV